MWLTPFGKIFAILTTVACLKSSMGRQAASFISYPNAHCANWAEGIASWRLPIKSTILDIEPTGG
ncbi:hypothetical protein Ga0123461_0589 [Mariprofundus aestuarium]|uniref:Uncharacterized protein n=1 Tax=Mariprofundus aestuarium TaxID=1921086 RepID=A0A2K8L249_MARES|nr:hypothetical protein Ga0123461_0589 [Mariprofundus aestuarium]